MQILTERKEFIAPDFAGKAKQRRAFPDPLPLHPLVLGVVITDAQVFLEVALRVLEIVLCLRRKHPIEVTRDQPSLAPTREPRSAAVLRERCVYEPQIFKEGRPTP